MDKIKEKIKVELGLTEAQLGTLSAYIQAFSQANRHTNLSAIRDKKDIWLKHVYDSLLIGSRLPPKKEARLLDLGTGGGFPGIPIKILRPDLSVTFMDSVAKKLRFIQEASQSLKIDGLFFEHCRAEDGGRDPRLRASFDFVLARSVAYLPTLVEYSLPFLKEEGLLLAGKLRGNGQELKDALPAMDKLGAKLVAQHFYQLEAGQEERQVLIIKKIRPTPKGYPRKVGLAKKKPIL